MEEPPAAAAVACFQLEAAEHAEAQGDWLGESFAVVRDCDGETLQVVTGAPTAGAERQGRVYWAPVGSPLLSGASHEGAVDRGLFGLRLGAVFSTGELSGKVLVSAPGANLSLGAIHVLDVCTGTLTGVPRQGWGDGFGAAFVAGGDVGGELFVAVGAPLGRVRQGVNDPLIAAGIVYGFVGDEPDPTFILGGRHVEQHFGTAGLWASAGPTRSVFRRAGSCRTPPRRGSRARRPPRSAPRRTAAR